jgi:ribosomal protein L9
LFKEGGESTTVKPPYSARNPPSPHSKSKLPSSYTQNEILNENAQLRKENEMLKKMNDVLKRELERRKSFSVPAEAASNVPKDLRQVNTSFYILHLDRSQ